MLGQSVVADVQLRRLHGVRLLAAPAGRARSTRTTCPCGADGTPLAIRIRAPKLTPLATLVAHAAPRSSERDTRSPSASAALGGPEACAGCGGRLAGVGGAPRSDGRPSTEAHHALARGLCSAERGAACPRRRPRRGRSGMAQVFDVVVVGGGTAGAITAARLSEDPSLSVCLLEAGPSDVGRDEVLRLRRWLELLESDYDYGYTTTLQPRGNAHIVHSRARVLGGCSSHNTQIWFKPLPLDWQDWVDAGRRRAGTTSAWTRTTTASRARTGSSRRRIATRSCYDWIEAAAARRRRARRTRTGTRRRSPTASASSTSATTRPPASARRRASCTCTRSWTSATNLSIQCESRALRLEVTSGRATGRARGARGRRARPHRGAPGDRRGVRVGRLAAPAALSGIGPRRDLERLGIESVHDLPGRRREPDRPPRVDHHLEAQAAHGPREGDGRRLRAVREPPAGATSGPT